MLTAFASAPGTAFAFAPSETRPIPVRSYAPRLVLERGETALIERKTEIKSLRLTRPISDLEGIVTGVTAPRGIVVHTRIDEVRFESKGPTTAITFRYAIHAEPDAKRGGEVRFTLALVERVGLVNTIATISSRHALTLKKTAKTKEADLTLYLSSYRANLDKARERQSWLRRAGIVAPLEEEFSTLDLHDVDAATAEVAHEFLRARRRMGVELRHLRAAATNRNKKIARLARNYLDLAKQTEIERPERVEPIGGESEGGEGRPATPVAKYVLGSEGAGNDEERPKHETAPSPTIEDRTIEPPPLETREDRSQQKRSARPYPRGLVLDDPNVGHSVGVRFGIANVRLRESALVPVFFLHGQVSLTSAAGLEFTVPASYVSADLDRARGVFGMGNPLIAGKYRFHLGEIDGRMPVLTLRARWGLPLSGRHPIPPSTQLASEDFSFPPYFADTYAFLLEKADVGLGFSIAWQVGPIYLGAQLYGDIFFPVERAQDQLSFFGLGYGGSVGIQPFDSFRAYAEARGTSLFTGPGRTEVFGYLGARGRFFDLLEPALWVSLPFGSVANVSGLQLGADLSIAYDVGDLLPSESR